MNPDQFWAIVEKGKDSDQPEEIVAEELEKLPPEEIVSYQQHFDALLDKAYTWDLWGAAYIIEGGCSDDGFMDFRSGLISRGRSVYERALKNPDSLADFLAGFSDGELEMGEVITNETFAYAAAGIYENKTGKIIPRAATASSTPSGQEWDFDDEEENARRFPRLMARYGPLYARAEQEPSGNYKRPSRNFQWRNVLLLSAIGIIIFCMVMILANR